MTDKEKISQRNTRKNSSRKVVGFKRPPHDILKSDTLIGDEVYDRGINEEETDCELNGRIYVECSTSKERSAVMFLPLFTFFQKHLSIV